MKIGCEMKSSKSKAGAKTSYVPQSRNVQPGSTAPSAGAGTMYCAPGTAIFPPGGGFMVCSTQNAISTGGPGLGMPGSPRSDMLAGLRSDDRSNTSNTQLKVDTIYNRNNNMPPADSMADMNAHGPGQGMPPLPPQCQADPLINCIAGLISNILPEGGQGSLAGSRGRRLTKDIYVGIPCNADRCCIDKFLGKPGACCPPTCGPPPGCCAQKCGGGCGGGSCGVQKCCCPPVCGAPKCCPRKGRRYKRRAKSQKSQQQTVENNNNSVPANPDGAPGPQYKDGGNYAQMTDAAVNAQIGQPGPPKRNVITGMMSRTMVGNIEDLNIPMEEVVVTPPRASNPSTPTFKSRTNYKGPRLTRFVIPSENEDDRSTRLDSRREATRSRPASSRGFTNFRDDDEGAERKKGKVWPLRPAFDR